MACGEVSFPFMKRSCNLLVLGKISTLDHMCLRSDQCKDKLEDIRTRGSIIEICQVYRFCEIESYLD